MEKIPIIQPDSDFLILIDIQNDLLPGGANPVPTGHLVLEPIYRIYPLFHNLLVAILTHFPNDPAIQQKPYCLLGTMGAEFPKEILTFFRGGRENNKIFTVILTRNHNDGFIRDNRMAKFLRGRGCKRVFIGGLPLEKNVKDIALHLKDAGFDTVILEDATKASNQQAGAFAKQDLQIAGIKFLRTSELFKE